MPNLQLPCFNFTTYELGVLHNMKNLFAEIKKYIPCCVLLT